MPYVYRKKDNEYVVYKKRPDGTFGKKVGSTKGTKEALRKYLAALHVNESTKTNNMIKLSNLINLRESEDAPVTTDQKKAFLESVKRFTEYSSAIYRPYTLKEASGKLKELIDAASQMTMQETQDWFDNVTVSRHMKHLGEAHKIFEKTASEIDTLQQRLEAAYEDIGSTLSKYYDINEMLSEAVDPAQTSATDYHKLFQKALRKFKIKTPADLATDKQRKRFFNWLDANYVSAEEKETEKED
jgi:hypothetical protein